MQAHKCAGRRPHETYSWNFFRVAAMIVTQVE
jgi:hypothetical protein